jgi:RNA polymerase sigma-70 factor (ECF subfamily)
MTEQELVQGITGRDQHAFRILVEKYQQHVIRTGYSLVHNLQDAEDIAQEVFIEIMDSIHSFRRQATLSSWIYRITVNKSLNHMKRRNRKMWFGSPVQVIRPAGSDQKKAGEITESKGADTALEEKEIRSALHLAIGRLPVNQRIAFTLHRYEELSYKEIAEIMNISLPSVESLLHRAKGNLQKKLERFYRDHLNS